MFLLSLRESALKGPRQGDTHYSGKFAIVYGLTRSCEFKTEFVSTPKGFQISLEDPQ